MKRIRTSILCALALFAGGACNAAAVPASPGNVTLTVEAGNAVLLADRPQEAMVRIAISAAALPRDEQRKTPGVNLAVAFDNSSSMGGDKIIHARQGAQSALAQLRDGDIFSLVIYSSSVNVLIPPTRIDNSVRRELASVIDRIQPGGMTALFGGVSMAAEQLRKMDRSGGRIQRLILLSDGCANVGPSTPAELGSLGTALAKEGITVSTVGIGNDYNENLMTALAQNADGNFYFVARSSDLPEFLAKELDSALAVAAQRIRLRITCPDGVKPRGILGFQCKIDGQVIEMDFNQIYAGHDKVLMLQVEVEPQPQGSTKPLAGVSLVYQYGKEQKNAGIACSVAVNFSADSAKVEGSRNPGVLREAAVQSANIDRLDALKEADSGNYAVAAERLRSAAKALGDGEEAKTLREEASKLEEAASAPGSYSGTRKEIKGRYFQRQNSQPVRQ